MALVGSGVALVLVLLVVAGVMATRPGKGSPAAAPASTPVPTAVVPDTNIDDLCGKLGNSLPAKARGLPLLPTFQNGHSLQQCSWVSGGLEPTSTWSLVVDVSLHHDTATAQSFFDAARSALENSTMSNVRTAPVPGLGDEALAGPIPGDSDVIILPPPPALAGIVPGVLPGRSRPGAAVLVRNRTAIIRVEWVGADLSPGTQARDTHATGTALPPEQAQREAVGVAADIVGLLGS